MMYTRTLEGVREGERRSASLFAPKNRDARAGVKAILKGQDMSTETIEDLIAKVSRGKTETFVNEFPPATNSRFMTMFQNIQYKPERLRWSEKVELVEIPNVESRFSKGRGFELLDRAGLVFDGPSDEVVDFYSLGATFYIVSDRLADLIAELDPLALMTRSLSIVTHDADVRMVAVLPKRIISAVDVARTEIVIESKVWSEDFVQTLVQFPHGISLREDLSEEIHVFIDVDRQRMYWSKALIDLCEKRGVRGVRAENAISMTSDDIIRL